VLSQYVRDNMYHSLYRFTKGTEREKAQKKESRMKLIEQFKAVEAMEARKKRRLTDTSTTLAAAGDGPAACVAAASRPTTVTTAAITSSLEVENAAR
jgi:hypothetical protein